MSTTHDHYILWGVRLPYDKVQYEQVERYEPGEEESEATGVIALYDGMNGDYVFVGVQLAKGTEALGFDEPVAVPTLMHGVGAGEIISQFAEWKNKVALALEDMGLHTLSLGRELGWHVVTHWR